MGKKSVGKNLGLLTPACKDVLKLFNFPGDLRIRSTLLQHEVFSGKRADNYSLKQKKIILVLLLTRIELATSAFLVIVIPREEL